MRLPSVARASGIALLTLTPACGRTPPASPSTMVLDPVPLVAEEITPTPAISPEGDGGGFAIASQVAFQDATPLVLETGNNRIVRFDPAFRAVGFIGREGAGPGELRAPVALAVWRDELAVMEAGNGRVTVFDTTGAYRRSFAVPNGFSRLAYGADGTLYVAAYDGKNYLLAANREGTLRPFGERAWELYPDDLLRQATPRVEGYVQFTVAADGAVYVYDPLAAGLLAFDPSGTRRGLCRLPPRLAGALEKATAAMMADFGGDRRRATANVTDLSAAPDGRLLLLFPNVGAIGLVVQPATCAAREVRWGPGLDPRYGGFMGVLRSDTLLRLSTDDLRLFRLHAAL